MLAAPTPLLVLAVLIAVADRGESALAMHLAESQARARVYVCHDDLGAACGPLVGLGVRGCVSHRAPKQWLRGGVFVPLRTGRNCVETRQFAV